jgi:tyrosyl-tRNA synthetase
MQSDEALSILKQGAAQIISETELRAKLELGRPLRVKLGVDPTSPDLHLGHSIILRKLRQFQDLGHEAVLIIGDFTSMIGDPSGRSATRPQLSRDQIAANAETYRAQAFKVLDPERTRLVANGDWLGKMGFEDVIRLNSMVTLQQMLQREDFRNRIDEGHPIHAHEIQYPIMQGWDSVMVQADVELGGTDQLFNCLVGRDLQKHEGQPQQVVLVLPILEGLDGSMKMSKSLGNYVGLAEPAAEMFGKLMSISDELMGRYYPLLLGKPLAPDAHPLEAKKHLAAAIVESYHSRAAAEKTLEGWNSRFSEKRLEDADLPTVVSLDQDIVTAVVNAYAVAFRLKKSRAEARRLIQQGSVQLDGVKLTDPTAVLNIQRGQVLRLDKTHAVRIKS